MNTLQTVFLQFEQDGETNKLRFNDNTYYCSSCYDLF